MKLQKHFSLLSDACSSLGYVLDKADDIESNYCFVAFPAGVVRELFNSLPDRWRHKDIQEAVDNLYPNEMNNDVKAMRRILHPIHMWSHNRYMERA